MGVRDDHSCRRTAEVARGPGDDDDDDHVTPIGDPDDDDWDDEDEDDDEEPLQVRGVAAGRGDAAMQHAAPNSGIINALR
jgi:hypothetical protein